MNPWIGGDTDDVRQKWIHGLAETLTMSGRNEVFMTYITAFIAGLLLGIVDLALLAVVQKHEKLALFKERNVFKQKIFWIVSLGLALIGFWYTWLIGGWGYSFAMQLLLCSYLLPISLVDLKYKLLPDLFHIVYGVIFLAFKFFFGTWGDLGNGVLGAACVLAFFGAVHLVKKDQFGLGDLKALCVCAFLVGIPGIIYLFFRGLVVAALYSVIQLLRHKAELKTEYPLAPFLLIGALI